MGKRVLIDTDQWPEIKHFADTVVAERKKRKISQKDLAEATGLTQPYISALESYFANPTMQVQAVITRAIGVSMASVSMTRRVKPDDLPAPVAAEADKPGAEDQ